MLPKSATLLQWNTVVREDGRKQLKVSDNDLLHFTGAKKSAEERLKDKSSDECRKFARTLQT